MIGRRGSARDTINMFNNIANVNKEKLDKYAFTYLVTFVILKRKKFHPVLLLFLQTVCLKSFVNRNYAFGDCRRRLIKKIFFHHVTDPSELNHLFFANNLKTHFCN